MRFVQEEMKILQIAQPVQAAEVQGEGNRLVRCQPIADSAHPIGERPKPWCHELMPEPSFRERRRTRRVRMKQGLRVRPSNPKDGPFEEISATANMSQDGVYFVTKQTHYREGMRLYVTVPYHSPMSPQNYEYLGQVARVDTLENGQRGIAVRFLPSKKLST